MQLLLCLPLKSHPAVVRGQQGPHILVFIECICHALPMHDLSQVPVSTISTAVWAPPASHTIWAQLEGAFG